MKKNVAIKPLIAIVLVVWFLFGTIPMLNSYGISGPERGDTRNEVVMAANEQVTVEKTLTKTATEGIYNIQFDVTGSLVNVDRTQPLNVVVIVDTSGSMNENGTYPLKWNNAKVGAIALSETLIDKFSKTGINLSLVTFSREATVNRDWADTAFTVSDFPSAPRGGTNMQAGLQKAAELLAEKENNIVVVVGDGEPTFYTDSDGNIRGSGSSMDNDTKGETIKAANDLKETATVLTLGYSVPANGEAERVLRDIASSSDFYSAANPITIEAALVEMVTAITANGVGSDAVLTDIIGQQFTYVGSDYAVAVSGDTVSFHLGELTDETKSFNFDVKIDPDSATGWYETNSGAWVDYIDSDGNSQRIELVESPLVYWRIDACGEFTIKKVDADNPSKTLAGAEFELLSGGEAMTFRQDAASGQYIVDSAAGTTTVITTDRNGLANISGLPQGTFTLRETKAPAEYYTASSSTWRVDVLLRHESAGWITYTRVSEQNGPSYSDSDGVITIANQYGILSTAKIGLVGRKVLTGAELKGNMFVFTVKDENGSVVSTGTNQADGTILFEEITYDTPGVYHYQVTEANTKIDGVTYDSKTVSVTVNVTDNGDGTMTATPVYPEGGVVFNNTYNGTRPTGGTVTLNLRKTLLDSSRNPAGNGKAFPVFIMDENFDLITQVNITANIGEVSISGLEGGKTYYLYEAGSSYYNIEGYQVLEKTVNGNKVVGISLPQIPSDMIGTVSLTVVNYSENVVEIPDDEIPLFSKPKEDDVELIEIGEDEIPLSPGPDNVPVTGDALSTDALFGIGSVALIVLTTLVVLRKKIQGAARTRSKRVLNQN